jgi:hypothetical protein
VVTLKNIESYVSSGQAKLLFSHQNTPIIQYAAALSSVCV